MNYGNVRSRLLATTIIAGSIAASPAYAQNAAPAVPDTTGVTTTSTTQAAAASAADADKTGGGEIVVTGSRIASPTLTSGAPLQIVDSTAIASTGAAVLQDVLQQNPVISSPTLSRNNSNFLTSSVGVATVDLRNLGTSRTLVLVDSHRFVSGIPNSQAVDLNSIPTPFIDHVEIVSGGESSIYGSDAVAGVVNIVYKKHFSGVEANVQDGISQQGDDKQEQANLTIGGNFAEDRGNVMVYAGYSKEGAVLSADRSRSAVDQTSLGANSTGELADVFTPVRPSYSSYNPQGSYQFGPGIASRTLDANGNPIAADTNGALTGNATGFNRSAYRYIAVPTERYLIASRATYEVSPAVNLFLETTFAHSHTVSQLEPFPIATAGTNGIFNGSGGFYPVEQRLADGSIFVNPLIPTGLVARTQAVNGDGLRDISFTRRLSDIGDRSTSADRNTYEITGGVRGDLSDKWHYEAYGSYGRTDDNQVNTGQVNLGNFRNALVVIPGTAGDPGAVLAPNGQYVVCASADARAEGCTPVNVYGANKITPAAAKYIAASSTANSFAQQIDIGANVTGNLWDLWGAGPIGVASGVEYRKESSAQLFDALTQSGQNGGNALPNTSGSFDVVEGYGEVHIPILKDKPFFKNLEARAAGRVSHYSTIGTVYSWSYGGIYQPIPDVTFRVSKALATRAPNVGELYAGQSQTFPTGLIDPCVGVTAATAGTLANTCRAAPGVNANIASNGSFVQTQSDNQGVSGFNGGNPALKQEKGHTFTAGMVVNPRSIEALRNFSFTVDYTRTHVTGAIVATPRQFILDQCYNNADPTYCQFITRRPVAQGNNSPGSIEFVNSAVTNSGGILTSAIDFTAGYKQGLGKYGSLNLTGSYTRLLKGYTIPLPGADKNYFAGELGAAKDKFLATVDWTIGPVTFEYRGQYIGRSYLDDQFVEQFTNDDGSAIGRHDPRARVSAKYYQDLQVGVDTGDHFHFYVGCNNLLNTSPPPIISGLPGDTTGTETDASDYDPIGRRFYAGARIRL